MRLFVLLVASLVLGASAQEPTPPPKAKPPSPIRRVVTLIEDMKTQVEKEAEEDKVAYDKYACWCKTNDAEKTAAIANAEKRIEELTALIEELAAEMAKLKTEIEQLEEDLAANQKALDTATAQREKEKAEFEAQEADLKEALAALKQAVDVLQKVQLMQKQGKAGNPEVGQALIQVRGIVRHGVNLQRYRDVLQADLWDFLGMSRDEKGFLQQPIEGGGAAPGAKSYNSRSGQILGILKQMMETFGKDLAAAQKEELTALINFNKLVAAKRAEIDAQTKQKNAKEEALAQATADTAQAKQDIEDTKAALGADQAFLLELKKNCKIADEEYAARCKIRGDELIALSEVLKMLTSDDARDLFGRSVGTSFLQMGSVSSTDSQVRAQNKARTLAVKRILQVAKKTKNWQLATLAVSAQLDAFTKVKEAMDKMLAELKKQQQEEYDKNEFCKKEIDANEDLTKVKTHEKEDLEDKKGQLENTIAALTAEIEKLKEEIAEMKVSLKRAGEDRKAENGEFQAAVADQRAVVNLLNKVMERLKMFYGGGDVLDKTTAAPALVQVNAHAHQEPGAAAPPPPPKPKGYQKSGGAGGVMQVIAMIIEDAEREEVELVHDEQKAQEAYASFVQETNACLAACEKSVMENEEFLATANADLAETEAALLATNEELKKLEDLNIALHKDCDFIMENFEIRQKARKEEMDAIVEAKAILSGADFGSF